MVLLVLVGCGRIGFDVRDPDATGQIPHSVLSLDRLDPSEPLLDVPLLVVLDDTRADRTRFQADAANVRFRDATGAPLGFEVEQAGAAGAAAFIAWVFVPRIEGLTTTIEVTYDDHPAPAPSSTWPPSYAAVWHLDDSGNAPDSTGQYNAVPLGTSPATPGVIVGARSFDGTETAVLTVAETVQFTPSQFTVSAWARLTAAPGGFFAFVARQVGDTSDDDVYLGALGVGAVTTCETAGGEFDVANGSMPVGTWKHVVGTADGVAALERLYVDGASIDMVALAGGALAPSNNRPFFIGGARSSASGSPSMPESDFLSGDLDEIRIETVARDAAWIRYEDHLMRDEVITYGPVLSN